MELQPWRYRSFCANCVSNPVPDYAVAADATAFAKVELGSVDGGRADFGGSFGIRALAGPTDQLLAIVEKVRYNALPDACPFTNSLL